PGITYSNGKYRVSKTFRGKNYSFGTIARLHDAKSVNKNVDAIIAFARETNGDLINENSALKGRVKEMEKEVRSIQQWSIKGNDKIENVVNERNFLRFEIDEHKADLLEVSYENERLKKRNLWQRIWNL